MRTTEGVWLSCTPTESYLLVSLDFEGVHSIERSAQEDALLVLFNTAISNLVLFRNNFVLSRDIAGLFASFQSSATVLDPNANRGLFNSILAIIIKDVPKSDTGDIVREFSLKFQQIVEKEQGQNFISRLHRGRIHIIPWPVINSPGFYTLFRHLARQLDQQVFTHGTAGAFLHNLKAVMAKIKAQDWGALDQNLTAHRAQQLLERLPRALRDGCTEEGPLKNMDTDEELDSNNGGLSFFVSEFTEGANLENDAAVELSLQALINISSYTPGPRQYILDDAYVEIIQNQISRDLDRRIDCVRNWATINVARFPSSNQDIRTLFGRINSAALAMRAAIRICAVAPRFMKGNTCVRRGPISAERQDLDRTKPVTPSD
ncbi:Vacuolar protein sorting-associated protein 13A [Ceratobasidium sp. 395]|nr:Vacuolar protein sorting-associated protein 13A [Ceratobasidium sp. 395]